MKCMHCNVELGAQHRVCPLCGEKAISAPLRVAEQTAEYPFLAKEKTRRHKRRKQPHSLLKRNKAVPAEKSCL